MTSSKSFAEILQQGLGRAFKYIQQNNCDRQQILADLLNACLHNLAYDPQCEPDKANYLFEMKIFNIARSQH